MNISCVRDMQRLRAMTLSVSPKSGVERVVYIQVLYPYTEAAGVLRLPKSAAALRPKSGVETVVCIQVLSIYGGCGCLRLLKSAADILPLFCVFKAWENIHCQSYCDFEILLIIYIF